MTPRLPLSSASKPYLERQARLNLLSKHLRDTPIEVRQDLHRKLRLDATLADQVVERIRERHADARGCEVSNGSKAVGRAKAQYLLRR